MRGELHDFLWHFLQKTSLACYTLSFPDFFFFLLCVSFGACRGIELASIVPAPQIGHKKCSQWRPLDNGERILWFLLSLFVAWVSELAGGQEWATFEVLMISVCAFATLWKSWLPGSATGISPCVQGVSLFSPEGMKCLILREILWERQKHLSLISIIWNWLRIVAFFFPHFFMAVPLLPQQIKLGQTLEVIGHLYILDP